MLDHILDLLETPEDQDQEHFVGNRKVSKFFLNMKEVRWKMTIMCTLNNARG